MKRFEKFDEFLNEKKKASPAQIAARKKFADMVADKKKPEDSEEKDTEKDTEKEEDKKSEKKKDKKSEKKKDKKSEKKKDKIKKFGGFTP